MTGQLGYFATLAGADVATAARLRVLLAAHPDPAECWHVVAGRAVPAPAVEQLLAQPLRGEPAGSTVGRRWAAALAASSPADAEARGCRYGIEAVTIGDRRYPAALAHDPDPPAVLFGRGDWGVSGGRRVGIVGTRNATATGLQVATTLGRELAGAGVCIVSGLALGIDAAAHRGALAAAPPSVLGVVANGVVEPYPPANAGLWERVARDGLLISEWPPGTVPERFRFPQRNRIIAGLAELVVVVESRERGGSMSTVNAAIDRGVEVMAVPGSVASRASRGTNELLRDGAAPVLSSSDVLLALGLSPPSAPPDPTSPGDLLGSAAGAPTVLPAGESPGSPGPAVRRTADAATGLVAPTRTGSPLQRLIVQRCSGAAVTIEQLVESLEVGLDDVAVDVAGLVRVGALRDDGGWLTAVAGFTTDVGVVSQHAAGER